MSTMREAMDAAYVAHPYYATALRNLRLQEDRSIPTMATSKYWVTHYNPDTLASWSATEAGAVLVHELEHLLRDHAGRAGERDHGTWNRAADAEINQRLDGLPDGAIYPETFGAGRGLTAETYYDVLGAPQQPEHNNGESGDGDGQSQGGQGTGQPGDGQPQGGQSGGQPGAGEPNCGSAAGGPVQPGEAGDAQYPGSGYSNAADVRKDAATAIVGQGTAVSDDLRTWAEAELGIDRARWYAAMAAIVGHTASPFGAPTRWQWPGRRDIRDMGGAMVPRWVGERPSAAIVIDTSGSITPTDLDMAAAAGHYIGRMADVVYYGCNTRATRYGSTLPEGLQGGGGTDLTVGIRQAIDDGARAVIVITDCMTPWPDEPTRVPLIIGANMSAGMVLDPPAGTPAQVVEYYAQWKPPEWATVLPITEGASDR